MCRTSYLFIFLHLDTLCRVLVTRHSWYFGIYLFTHFLNLDFRDFIFLCFITPLKVTFLQIPCSYLGPFCSLCIPLISKTSFYHTISLSRSSCRFPHSSQHFLPLNLSFLPSGYLCIASGLLISYLLILS